MGRPKGGATASSSSKKPKAKPKQHSGIDFKMYKHKVGSNLPPPKNATNMEIRSKAIVLLEQSMASERAGMAVNKRVLTLQELLQQTVHYNANVRGEERICDTDKVVRELLYNILQSLIFPSLKEDNTISTRSTLFLLMANIENL